MESLVSHLSSESLPMQSEKNAHDPGVQEQNQSFVIEAEQEQKEKEDELQRVESELLLTKQCTDKACKIATLNKSRAEQAH